MGDALVRLAGLIYVPPHVRRQDGKTVKVDGYWRESTTGKKWSLADPGGVPMGATVKAPHMAVDIQDQRTKGAKLEIDADKLDAVIAAVGIKMGPKTKIRLRLRDQKVVGEQGSHQLVGDDEHRIVIKIAPKKKYEDRHLYVMNNSLLHEFRHIRQSQDDPKMGVKYHAQNITIGYANNTYEIEARKYGRLADHTGLKDTGELGAAPGKTLWALRNAA